MTDIVERLDNFKGQVFEEAADEIRALREAVWAHGDPDGGETCFFCGATTGLTQEHVEGCSWLAEHDRRLLGS